MSTFLDTASEIVDDKVLEEAVSAYGVEAQFHVLMEECGELIQATAKTWRNGTNEEMASELADVLLMVCQAAHIIGNELVLDGVETKFLRLKRRLKEKGDTF